MKHKKLALAVAVTAALGVTAVNAAQMAAYQPVAQNGNNFSMLTPTGSGATGPNPNYDAYATPNDPDADPYARGGSGYAFGGSNRVSFTWDGTLFDSSADYTGIGSTSNATFASPDLFFGSLWTTHDVQIFGPGTYTFDSALANGGANGEAGTITMTVGANQIGAHMLFDWSGNDSIDVANVWNIDTTFGACDGSTGSAYDINCHWSGTPNPGSNSSSTVYTLSSSDDNVDGTLGIPMAPGGPFAAFNANFNVKGIELTPVPVPAAVWLFGSGLLGLVGVARRRKTV